MKLDRWIKKRRGGGRRSWAGIFREEDNGDVWRWWRFGGEEEEAKTLVLLRLQGGRVSL